MDKMKLALLFFIAILPFLAASPTHAQGAEPPIPSAPPAGSYVLDELDWLTSEQETRINSIIHGMDRDGVAELAVVTLDDCGRDKLAFRKSLFDTWGIGHADDNDGLLILVCWYGGDPSRRSVEQLYGPGLNGALKSGVTGETAQQRFVPAFEAGKPGDGLVRMVSRYNDILRYAASYQPSNPLVRFISGMDDGTKFTGGMLLAAALLLVLNKFLPVSVRERIEEWTRSSGDHWGDGGGFGGGSSDGGGGSSTRF